MPSGHKPKFKIGDRVHWYEYSSDLIIINGGRGMIVEVCAASKVGWDCYLVLKDKSLSIEEFTDFDLQREQPQ